MVALKPLPAEHGHLVDGRKQERRGGIETAITSSNRPARSPKQERRGGIETIPGQERPGRAQEKQERRGGIETSMDPGSKVCVGQEAGTPWWH